MPRFLTRTIAYDFYIDSQTLIQASGFNLHSLLPIFRIFGAFNNLIVESII